MFSPLRIFWAALILVSVNQIDAQETRVPPSPLGNLVLKRTVRRVIVDVVVTDRDGKPVSGLEKSEFTVKEDGSSQQILSFEKHDWASGFVPPKLPQFPPNTFLDVPAAPERGPLYILLLDLVNTHLEDQATARQQLLKFINEKPAGVRLAIFVLSDELRMVQGFTDDQKQLYEAMDPHSPKPHVPRIFLMGRNFGQGNIGLMVHVFNNMANFLNGLAGRKNLIWLSGDFPMTLYPTDEDAGAYHEEIKDTLNKLARGQVAIYPVDVRGVVVTDSYSPAGSSSGGGGTSVPASGSVSASSAANAASISSSAATAPSGSAASSTLSAPSTGNLPTAGTHGTSLLMGSYATQDEIASITGGHAFHSTNDIKGALGALTEMGANYYTLSYSPANENYDGKLRSIRVELSRKGYTLSYRRSYYAEDPDAPKSPLIAKNKTVPPPQRVAGRPADSFDGNMQHGAPMSHEIFFSAHIHPTALAAMATPEQMGYFADQPAFLLDNPKKKRRPAFQVQPYVVDFFIPKRQFSRRVTGSDSPTANLEFATVVFDADGRILNSIVQMSQQPISETWGVTAQQVGYRVLQNINVPATAISMRVAVRDTATNHIGTLEIPLPVAPESPLQAAYPADPFGVNSAAK